ncbi:MAG: DNA-protecting protein DprA [Candidatus Omnitrophica bacterium]|nr:DNA-protecting protein DprA [Candidatus Omnitrophota bacterium]
MAINAKERDIIALSMVPGIGASRLMRLVDKFDSLRPLFDMSLPEFKELFTRNGDITASPGDILRSGEIASEISFMEAAGIKPVFSHDGEYPEALRNIDQPPIMLFSKGTMIVDDIRAVAIVGARMCTAYGLRMAEKLAYDLAKNGITVVSGLAKGIDQASHRGALMAGGRTIAVMGSGFRNIYPDGAQKMVDMIASNGAVLTEYHSNMKPLAFNFPARNRIISGLSRGVVVVEAGERSGALITVDYALEQGRDVFAVPGCADNRSSRGSNKLIQDGAKLVTSARDILEEMGIEAYEHVSLNESPGRTPEGENEKRVIRAIGSGEIGFDLISETTGIETGALPGILIGLELKNIVRALPGARYALK